MEKSPVPTAAFTDVARPQYALVRSARKAVFAYCSTLSPADFTAQLPAFGGSGVRSLLVHIADVYKFWLGSFALRQTIAPTDPESVKNIDDIRRLFAQTDVLVEKFLHHFQAAQDKSITGEIPGMDEPFTTTPLALFTHGIMHEFHHKGQIMSMTRQLGYTPPDTDIIRFS